MKVLLSIIILFISIVALLYFIFSPGQRFLTKQEEGNALKQILGRNLHEEVQISPTNWIYHENSAVKFLYPSWARVYQSDNKKAMQDPNIIDSFSINMPDDHVYIVEQAVRFIGNLSDYPAVNVRLSQPEKYMPDGSGSAKIKSIAFSSKGDMFEKTIFIKNNTALVSFAVTGYSQTKVEDYYSKLMGSLAIQ